LIDPGVSGATWLGIPPGNENWRKRRAMPAASRLTVGYTSEYVPSSHVLATRPGPPWPGPVT
jgi:hypothetical protein